MLPSSIEPRAYFLVLSCSILGENCYARARRTSPEISPCSCSARIYGVFGHNCWSKASVGPLVSWYLILRSPSLTEEKNLDGSSASNPSQWVHLLSSFRPLHSLHDLPSPVDLFWTCERPQVKRIRFRLGGKHYPLNKRSGLFYVTWTYWPWCACNVLYIKTLVSIHLHMPLSSRVRSWRLDAGGQHGNLTTVLL